MKNEVLKVVESAVGILMLIAMCCVDDTRYETAMLIVIALCILYLSWSFRYAHKGDEYEDF